MAARGVPYRRRAQPSFPFRMQIPLPSRRVNPKIDREIRARYSGEWPMPQMKMRDVKVGEAIMHNNEVWLIFDRHEQTRGNLRTYWQIKLKHLERGNVVEQRFSPDDNVEKVILFRQEFEYLYRDGDSFVIMHPQSYEQINIAAIYVP